MNRTIRVKHTADRHHRPLAVVHGLPGDGADLNSLQLRRLAVVLEDIADVCDQGAGISYPENAIYDLAQTTQQNPFVAYRPEITGGYSTGQRLAALTLHLYNGAAHGVRLDNLFGNADARHTRIALELLAWYAKHGENCVEFMALARELAEEKAAA
jgi:hypothetical protein